MATILVEVLGNAKQFKAEMAEVSASAERSTGGLAKMGKAAGLLGVALAGGVAYGLVKSVDAAGKFQSSMELIQTQAGGSAKEVKNMSKALLDMASSVGQTPETLSKGLYHVESAGFRGAKALSILRLAAEGAAVGHSDLEQTTTALVAAERTGIKGLGDMSHAMGTLNAIVGAGNMRMDDLTSALGTGVLVSAKAFGISIQDVGGALATMTSNGIPAVNAASGLKMMFASLAAPTHAAAKALDSIGLSSTDLATTMRSKGLGPALVELKQHMKDAGLNAVQSAALLTTAFGKKSSTGLLTLLGNMKDMKKATDQISTGAKTFGANWAETQKTAEFATARFHAAIGALEIRIGAALLPTVTRFTNWLTSELPTAISAAQGVIKDLTPTFDKVRDAIEAVGSKLGDAISLFESMKGHSDALKAALAVVVTGILAITAATVLMNLAFLANPIVLLIAGLAALAAGLVLAYQNSATFRNIVNEAFSAVKTVASASLGYITGTLIPMAIAAWQKFGPQVATAIHGAVSAVQQGMADIKAVIVTVLDFIKGHWNDIWSVLGPIVKGALEVAKTSVQTTLNVIADVVRAFSDLLHGRWGAAWGELKNVVSDVLNGIVSMVGSILRGLATSAGALAKLVGEAIVKGVKSAVAGLAGLAGDLTGKITAAISQVAGWALGAAASIGTAIGQGVINGIQGMAGSVASAAEHLAHSAVGAMKSALGISSPSKVMADEVGAPMAQGISQGFTAGISGFVQTATASLHQVAAAVASETKKNAPAVASAFGSWASEGKKEFDAQAAGILKSLDAQLAKGQAAIARMKAKLTPAELKIQIEQAAAQLVGVQSALDAAWVAIHALPAAQAQAWSQLLAQQQANIAALKATLQSTTDDAILAGNTFNKGMAAAAGDPLAATLIAAQQTFNSVKDQFDKGLATQAQFVAAADALDAAKLAASQDSNATTLLDQYNTWQAALAQQASAGAAITAQQAADGQAQADMQASFAQQRIDAEKAKDDALQALLDYNLAQVAAKERADQDARAASLNTALVARYNRIKTHLENVVKATDSAFDQLGRMATKSGGVIGQNLAQAMRDSIPLIDSAAKALAETVSKYLKTKSPSELGPLSDLDHWWDGFAPALIKGLDTKMITSSISGALNPTLAPGMGGYGSAAPAMRAAAPATGGDTHLHFNHTPADADPVAIASSVAWQMRMLRS